MKEETKTFRNIAELYVHMFNKLNLDCLRYLCTEIEITPAQFAALKYLAQHQRNLLSDLAEGLNISNAAVTKMTDRLEKKGLVERITYSGDRRATALQLTAQGKTLLSNIRKAELAVWETIVGRMKPTDRQALLSGMTGFIHAMLEDVEDVSEVCLKCGIEHHPSCPLGNYNK